MRKLLIGLALFVMTACYPVRYAEVDVAYGPNPWYSYCTWDYPCWYPNDVVFIYGWGWFPRERYFWYYHNQTRIRELPHYSWKVPKSRPQGRGRDWNKNKGHDNDKGQKEKGRKH